MFSVYMYMVPVCGWDVSSIPVNIGVCPSRCSHSHSVCLPVHVRDLHTVSHCPGITQLHCMSTPSVTHISYNVEIVDLVTIVY